MIKKKNRSLEHFYVDTLYTFPSIETPTKGEIIDSKIKKVRKKKTKRKMECTTTEGTEKKVTTKQCTAS